MNQQLTATRFGFGLLGSLCLLLRPLMALVCFCCCNSGKTANAETQSPCCAAATCCVTAEESAETGQQASDQCCGSETCCQPLPQFLTVNASSRETSAQDWFARTVAVSKDGLPECSTAASWTAFSSNAPPPPLQQRLAALCVWRN